MKDDILKSILETDEDDISRVLKEAGLEGEAAGVLEAAAKLLKAYKDELQDGAPGMVLSKEALEKMDPATQAIVKHLQEENEATKSEARRRESEGRIKRHGWREHSFAPSIIIIHY